MLKVGFCAMLFSYFQVVSMIVSTRQLVISKAQKLLYEAVRSRKINPA